MQRHQLRRRRGREVNLWGRLWVSWAGGCDDGFRGHAARHPQHIPLPRRPTPSLHSLSNSLTSFTVQTHCEHTTHTLTLSFDQEVISRGDGVGGEQVVVGAVLDRRAGRKCCAYRSTFSNENPPFGRSVTVSSILVFFQETRFVSSLLFCVWC
jgi:hypothetical protein